jgi:hypothetical protein
MKNLGETRILKKKEVEEDSPKFLKTDTKVSEMKNLGETRILKKNRG